jgi:hypothetical protein
MLSACASAYMEELEVSMVDIFDTIKLQGNI